MKVTCNWSIKGEPNIASIISIAETPKTITSDQYIHVEKKECTDPCEVIVAFDTAVKLNSINWISTARICEVYVVEHGKIKASYLGTKRCVMMDEKLPFGDLQIQMYTGETDFPSSMLVDSIKIRFLSIKEKTFALLQNVTFVGKQTIIDSITASPVDEHPDRLRVPKPLQPEDSISSALQSTFAQQVLFEGKMKSLEERLGLQMERLVTTLTLSYKKQFDDLNKRMEMMEDILINLVEKVNDLDKKVNSNTQFCDC